VAHGNQFFDMLWEFRGEFSDVASNKITAEEIASWHCFYALNPNTRPLSQPGLRQRRGLDHRPLYVVMPQNHMGKCTFEFEDTGRDERVIIDFIAVDEGSFQQATSNILTSLATVKVVSATGSPSLSDHLPVEGIIQI
jgi:hypothetical protein